MHTTRRTTTIALVIVSISLALQSSVYGIGDQPPIALYTITDLGPLPGHVVSVASAVNEEGVAVGRSSNTPVRWVGGVPQALGALPGGPASGFARSINTNGLIAGVAEDASGKLVAVVWTTTTAPTSLGTLAGFDRSDAADITNDGWVAGSAYNTSTGVGAAFVWDGSVMRALPNLPSATNGGASAINSAKTVVGGSGSRAVMWLDDAVAPLGVLPGDSVSGAADINSLGWVVGYSDSTGTSEEAVLWRDGTAIGLSALPGDARSWASSINDAGLVVGTSVGTPPINHNGRAVLWDARTWGTTRIHNLIDLVIGPNPFVTLRSATAITNAGLIVGFGDVGGRRDHGFLLTPVSPDALDQAFMPALNESGPVEGNSQISQTFKVGVTGMLTGLDLPIARETNPPAMGDIVVSILPTNAGVPALDISEALGTIHLPATYWPPRDCCPDAGLYRHLEFGTPISVVAGDELAIVVHRVDDAPIDTIYWYGNSEGGYDLGRAFTRAASNVPWIAGDQDKAFVTYVEPAADSECLFRFSSGHGPASVAYCVSETGTLAGLAAPIGQEHLAVGSLWEGYVLCSGTTVQAWDLTETSGGFGTASVIAGPTATGVTIRRSSEKFRLDQQFKLDKAEKDITITMTLTNISGAVISDVRMARAFDPDVNGDFGDDLESKTARTVTASDADAITLSAITWPIPADTSVGTPFYTNPWTIVGAPPACSPPSATPPVLTGDGRLATVTYRLGNMPAGTKKKAVFVYRFQ